MVAKKKDHLTPQNDKRLDALIKAVMDFGIDVTAEEDLSVDECGHVLFWAWLTFETFAAEKILGPDFQRKVMEEMADKTITQIIQMYRTGAVLWEKENHEGKIQ